MADTIFDFVGGENGQWKVIKMDTISGDRLESVSYIKVNPATIVKSSNEGLWSLKGIISNLRYTEKQDKENLAAIQASLGRPEATLAAFIPIRKSDEWWALAQDERREIFEKQSHHTQTGIKYLPPIARKLYHCRDIGEPFDFVTWFEYAPSHSDAFEELVKALRNTEEWKYIDREIDIRLTRLPC